jgi:rare lipoprotein A
VNGAFGTISAPAVFSARKTRKGQDMRRMARALVAGGPLLWASPALPMDEEDRGAHVERGEASWYGDEFHGKPTAGGEPFDQNALTAAHPDLPLGAEVEVTNLANGRSVEVEINDRGPFVEDRVIDLSKGAAEELDMIDEGTAPVRIEADPDRPDKAGAERSREPKRATDRAADRSGS